MSFSTFIVSALVLHLTSGQYHSSSARAGVSFENISPSYAVGGALAQSQSENRPRQRRMYAMCPPNFQRIGQECFTYPQQHSSWLEAHFFCKDKNARLAEPEKYSDRKLREFLLKYDEESGDKDPIWIGATYDYINNIWQWSISGRNLTYNAFSKKYYEHNPDMDNQCAVYDPQLRYRWSSRTCVDKHRFICQHKMPKVSENNRHKVYHRWNATYPNQYANEVVLEVIDHRGKGRYNRRVIAEGSSEEMIVSTRPRNRQNTRRRPKPSAANLPQENDVNYQQPQLSGAHPNDVQQNLTPTKHPRFLQTTLVPESSSTNNNDNEISAPNEVITSVPDNVVKTARRRTMHDRKLQRQREKELRRMQRKKERQERMRKEKEERLKKMRLEREQQRRKMKEEKQKLRLQQQKELEELRQKESDQAVDRQERERQDQQDRQHEIEDLRRQKDVEEKKHLEDQEEERRRQAYLQTLKEQEEQEKARKEEIQRADREKQMEEEQRLREERRILEERKRQEYEQKLKEAQNERARELAEEQERKRLHDEEYRRKLEEEEKQRQAELKRQLEEEEERLRLQRLEEERIAEEKELARLREEQRKRAEIQRKREEEIARLEAAQRRIEQEEERIKEELEESERQAKLQREAEIIKAEAEARAKEEESKRAEDQEERERQEKLKQAKIIEESRKVQNKENLSSSLKNRLASLSPELRKEFVEKRKQRKREKLLKEKILKQQQQADSTNNEA